jgi:hypothetical protein
MQALILPRAVAIGDMISYANEKSVTREGRKGRFTFAGSEYFKRMQAEGLYTIDKEEIARKIEKLNLTNVFGMKLV